jgi:hypothetical protein
MAAKFKKDEVVIQIVKAPITGKVKSRLVDGDDDKFLVEWEEVDADGDIQIMSRYFSEDEIESVPVVEEPFIPVEDLIA